MKNSTYINIQLFILRHVELSYVENEYAYETQTEEPYKFVIDQRLKMIQPNEFCSKNNFFCIFCVYTCIQRSENIQNKKLRDFCLKCLSQFYIYFWMTIYKDNRWFLTHFWSIHLICAELYACQTCDAKQFFFLDNS